MPEKFNFNQLDLSKEDDQKKYDQEFDKLPKDEQKEIVGEAQEEAEWINKLIETGRAKDYDEADKLIKDINRAFMLLSRGLVSFSIERYLESPELIPSQYNHSIESLEFRTMIKKMLSSKLTEKGVDVFIEVIKRGGSLLRISQEEIREVAEPIFKEYFLAGKFFEAEKLKSKANLIISEEILNSEEVQGIIRKEFLNKLIELKNKSKETNGFVFELLKGLDFTISGVKLNIETLKSEQIQSFVKGWIIELLSCKDIDFNSIHAIINSSMKPTERTLSDNEIQEKLSAYSSRKGAHNLLYLIKKTGLELSQEGFEQIIISQISNGSIKDFIEIINLDFKPSTEFSKSIELKNALSNAFPQGISLNDLIELNQVNRVGDNILSIYKLKSFNYPNQIKSILKAQGDTSYLYFESIKGIKDYTNLTVEDIEYITLVGKKYGTQARNILENILSKVGAGNIGQEKEIIEEYLSEIGIAHFDIYSQYNKAKTENNPEELEKMKEKIGKMQDGIYKEKMEEKDFEDSLYPAISYHTFPPAIGLTQDQYNQLNKTRPDRRNDVPESLDELQYQKIEVSTGKYNLGEGEELDLKEWTALGKAIKKVNAEFEKEGKLNLDESEIAEKLIEMYKKKSSEKGEDQEYLFESMYRYHLAHNGGKLESGFEISIEGLMQYKEFIGDRIKNDLIKDCLAKWRETHEKEFEELKNDTMNRLRNSQSQNFAKVSNMLGAISKQNDPVKKEKTISNLDEFLKNFGMSYEMIKGKDIDEIKLNLETVVVEYEGDLTEENYQSEEYYNSEAFLKSYDEFLAKHDSDQLVYQKIGSDLIAGINKKMRKEVDKFKFEDQAGQAEKRELEFVISKKKEHGVAGFNMGVCVAPDEKLWNDPQFMNCIIFDPKLKQAMGGMHFLIRENNLCLPGINPSLDVLGQVKNEELFDKMMEYAKKIKEKMGLEKILIPESSSIHSNRTQIQEIIRKKAFKKYKLQKEVEFSYSPYKYSFQECFEV